MKKIFSTFHELTWYPVFTGAYVDPRQEYPKKQPVGKAVLSALSLKKYGKKAFIIYVCWCFVKSALFILAGWLTTLQ